MICTCFNCDKSFKEADMKHADVPNNFSVSGHDGDTVEQCPHCDAVAFVGFNRKPDISKKFPSGIAVEGG